MSITVDQLAQTLEVNSNTIFNWESELGLEINSDEFGTKWYSDEFVAFFKKVRSLFLNGYSIEEIKDMLFAELERLNPPLAPTPETIIYVENNENNDNLGRNSEQDIFNNIPKSKVEKSEITALFQTILNELKLYTERTIAAEKRVYLLEDYENRSKKEYFELSSQVKQLKTELDDKEKKLKEFEEQKKRLNLMEVQLKLVQLEKSKKKFWEFWK